MWPTQSKIKAWCSIVRRSFDKEFSCNASDSFEEVDTNTIAKPNNPSRSVIGVYRGNATGNTKYLTDAN